MNSLIAFLAGVGMIPIIFLGMILYFVIKDYAREVTTYKVNKPEPYPEPYYSPYPKLDNVKVKLNDGSWMWLVMPDSVLMFEQNETDKYWEMVKEKKGTIVIERTIEHELPFKSFMNHLWNECNPHKDLLFEKGDKK